MPRELARQPGDAGEQMPVLPPEELALFEIAVEVPGMRSHGLEEHVGPAEPRARFGLDVREIIGAIVVREPGQGVAGGAVSLLQLVAADTRE